MNKYNYIASEGNCITNEQLLAYLNNTLDKEQIWNIENHITDCEICCASLDGYWAKKDNNVAKHIEEIKKQVEEKIHATTPTQENIRPLKPQRNYRKYWAVAASLLFVIGVGAVSVYNYINPKASLEKDKYAKDKTKEGTYKTTEQNGEITQIEAMPDAFETKTEEKKESLKKEKSESKSSMDTKKSAKEIIAYNKVVTPIANGTAVLKDAEQLPASTPIAEEKNSVAQPVKKTNTENNIAYNDADKVSKTESEAIDNNNSGYGLKRSKEKNDVANTYSRSNQSYPSQQQIRTENVATNKNINTVSISQSQQYYNEGVAYYSNGNYRKSIKALENALESTPVYNKEDILYTMANCYLKINKTEKAYALFEQLKTSVKYKQKANEMIMKK